MGSGEDDCPPVPEPKECYRIADNCDLYACFEHALLKVMEMNQMFQALDARAAEALGLVLDSFEVQQNGHVGGSLILLDEALKCFPDSEILKALRESCRKYLESRRLPERIPS
jgi:hypothetical protein